jgi:hypothetical protein
MLKFIDLTGSYWNDPECPISVCAFLANDLFLTASDGLQVFMYPSEVDEHQQADQMNLLLPIGFFDLPYATQKD